MLRFSSCGLPANLRLGPSASESNASTSNYSSQTSVQGSAGAGSPTIVASGAVDYNDPQLEADALTVAGNAITSALSNAGSTNTTIASLAANQAQTNAQVNQAQQDSLNAALNAEQTLAAAQGTGGASITATSTNYLIWGGIAIAAVAVFALIFAIDRR